MRIPVTATLTITADLERSESVINRVTGYLLEVEAVCILGAKLHGADLEWFWEGQTTEHKRVFGCSPPRHVIEACWSFSAAYDAECGKERADDLAGYLEADIEAELCNLKARANRYGWAEHVDYHTRVDRDVMRWSA